MLGLLCLNLILCSVRLLVMLSISRSLGACEMILTTINQLIMHSCVTHVICTAGVMTIITKTIVRKDVFPFIIFTAIIISAFEFAAFYFSWLVGTDFVGGYFFNMFTALGDFQQFQPDLYKLPWWDREDTVRTIIV
jgi:hypothetical protein